MPFCLAQWDDWRSNIILPEVSEYISARSADAQQREVPFPLHKYLHHGMSSQAMAFNLIGPLITRNDYSPLAAVLKARQVPGADDIAEAVFEYEDRDVFNEDTEFGLPATLKRLMREKGIDPESRRIRVGSYDLTEELYGAAPSRQTVPLTVSGREV